MKRALEVQGIEMLRRGRMRVMMRPLSWLYALAIHIRHRLYDCGWFAQKHVSVLVVSIGNLVVGGVGKTQVTLLLAQKLQKVAILSRGFRGRAEKGKKALLVSVKNRTAEECGDEPWLLASYLPKSWVLVNRNRYLSALEAKRLGARVILLDDGMQHRRLFRNIEIVVLDGSDPFGGGLFLPSGLLRETPKRLAKADLIVFVGNPTHDFEKKINALTKAPFIVTQICVKQMRLLNRNPIASLRGVKVGLFCGIGNPNRFLEMVQAQGAIVVASHFLPDHKAIKDKELKTFATFCEKRHAQYLLCTEKDRIKLPSCARSSSLPIGWIGVELEVVKNLEVWDRMAREITKLAGIQS